MNKRVIILTYIVTIVICLYIGYEYSKNTKEYEIARAVAEQVAYNNGASSLASSYFIYSLVNNIDNDDKKELYRKTCLYLKLNLKDVEEFAKTNPYYDEKMVRINQKLILIKEYIKEGQTQNNCEYKSVSDVISKIRIKSIFSLT